MFSVMGTIIHVEEILLSESCSAKKNYHIFSLP